MERRTVLKLALAGLLGLWPFKRQTQLSQGVVREGLSEKLYISKEMLYRPSFRSSALVEALKKKKKQVEQELANKCEALAWKGSHVFGKPFTKNDVNAVDFGKRMKWQNYTFRDDEESQAIEKGLQCLATKTQAQVLGLRYSITATV